MQWEGPVNQTTCGGSQMSFNETYAVYAVPFRLQVQNKLIHLKQTGRMQLTHELMYYRKK